jgi:hypothetical protein
MAWMPVEANHLASNHGAERLRLPVFRHWGAANEFPNRVLSHAVHEHGASGVS